tara:strand:+ start:3889 stop:5391 length:1503 start_codon:yes stop_codon:yes gene_type:complete
MASKDYRFNITAQNKTQQAFSQVNRSLDKTSKSMAFMKKSFVGLIGTAAIASFGRQTLQTADDLAKVSSSIGVSAEFLQRFQFAAEQSGVAAEGFDKSLRFFSKTMGEATMGLGLGLDAIQQLGVSLKDTEGNTKSIDALFIEMMHTLDGVENATEKAGLATKLFGRAGIPMVNMLRDGHQAMLDLAEVAPGVLTDEDTKRAEEFNDAMNVLARTVRGPVQSAIISLVNLPSTIKETLTDVFFDNDAFNPQQLEQFFGRVNAGVTKTGEELKIVDKRVIAFAERINESLKTPTEKIADFREELEEAVQAGIFDKNKVEAAVAVFSESVTKGVEDTMTVVKQFEDTIEGSLEGAFTDFFDRTSEGFMNMNTLFKTVIDSIIQEVLRLAVIKPIVDYIMGGPVATISSIFGKASGGPVTGGRTYMVGERGPELFTAPGNGNIVPNNKMGMAGGGTTNVNITYDIKAFDSKDATAAIAEQAPTIVGIVEQSFNKRGRRGPLGT